MPQVNRTTLKSYFLTGNKPTAEQFGDLIDSGLNFQNDILTTSEGKMAVNNNTVGQATLYVKGNLTVSASDTQAPDNGLYVENKVYIGKSDFTGANADLAIDGGVYIGSTAATDPGDHSLQVDGNIKTSEVRARDGNGLKLYEDSGTSGLLINDSGNIEIDGNLTFDSGKHVVADEIRALSGSGLKLYEDSGTSGLLINDSGNVDIGGSVDNEKLCVTGTFRATGDSNMEGNLTFTDSKYIEVPKVQAKSGQDLSLVNDTGAGITIHDDSKSEITFASGYAFKSKDENEYLIRQFTTTEIVLDNTFPLESSFFPTATYEVIITNWYLKGAEISTGGSSSIDFGVVTVEDSGVWKFKLNVKVNNPGNATIQVQYLVIRKGLIEHNSSPIV